ncbi:MAG: M14 family zinc carboxypeptidase [Lysobacterales bacterium]
MRLRLLLVLTLVAAPLFAAESPLRTEAERSGFVRTGRYAEVERLCAAFAERYPEAVRCLSFGQSPEGRPMKLLVVTHTGVFDPAAARQQGIPVLLFQGGIHAGEIDGKDAGFLALAEMLENQAAAGALKRVVWLFVPVFNVDGHERFKAWSRPNQRGPAEMGWRTTAQNLNLNRDYVKAEAPEMQAMLGLLAAWDPIVMADLHVTDGAQFEHDVAIQVEPHFSGDTAMRGAGTAMRDQVIAEIKRQGSLPLPFYPSFDNYDDPASGITDGVATPRFSLAYWATRNRFGMLVETHSWKDYATRVRITRNTIVALTALTARDGRHWRELASAADRAASRLGGGEVAVAYAASDVSRNVDFRGYAYTRTPSAISGGLMTRYDESRPEIWKMPLRDQVAPSQMARLPGYAYAVPAAEAGWLGSKLALHGIRFQRTDRAIMVAKARVFRADKVSFAPTPFEGRTLLQLDGRWAEEAASLAPGSLIVPVADNNGRLLAALLDPQAPDSFVAWGFFNNAFEAKEYMEPYVAEDIARSMLAANPALAQAFNQRLASDPAFAASPQARLDFFYRRHSAWDDRRDRYPVIGLDQPLP